MNKTLILASGSRIRRDILSAAKIPFTVIKSDVDEDKLKAKNSKKTPAEMSVLLSGAKAETVSEQYPDSLVLGADQTMELDGRLLDKLPERELAADRLREMRGKVHYLHAGLSLALGGETIWTHAETSTLHVREFSDEFLEFYLASAGGELTASVGAYAYEGLGAQLFEKVEADYYAVLGLPLVPLQEELRRRGLLQA